MLKSKSEKYKVFSFESSRFPKYNFWEPLQAKMDWKEKYETLSSSSKNFGSKKKHTKWGGGRRPPPLFVCFSATQNCSDWCLSLVFVPFNPFWLAGANHKITFWGPWTYLKINLHCKLRDLVALQGQRSKKTGTCESKVACKFSERKKQSALNHVLIL